MGCFHSIKKWKWEGKNLAPNFTRPALGPGQLTGIQAAIRFLTKNQKADFGNRKLFLPAVRLQWVTNSDQEVPIRQLINSRNPLRAASCAVSHADCGKAIQINRSIFLSAAYYFIAA